jgi:TolB-like protein
MKKFYLLSLILLISTVLCAEKILVLPFQNNSLDQASLQTAHNYLAMLLDDNGQEVYLAEDFDYGSQQILTQSKAIELGNKYNTNEVLYISMQSLGDKIIVLAKLIDVNSETVVFSDKLTAEKIEDLDSVMDRIITGVIEKKNPMQSARIGNIIENENRKITRRRKAKQYNGITFGYLFPLNGFDDDNESKFTIDYRLSFEMEDSKAGILLGWREGFATSLFYNHLLSKQDISPYIGGNLGFHWVSHDEEDEYDAFGYQIDNDDKREDGVELGLNCGVHFFRTYNFQMVANLEYTMTFNDYDDQCIIFTIGLTK